MSNTPKLVIDAQILQTAAWSRGMGHYCKSILQAYAKEYGSDDVTIILNKHLLMDDERTAAIAALMPEASVVTLDLPTLTGDIAAGKRMATGRLDDFIGRRFPDETVTFLILQLFTFDYCAAFPTRAHKEVVVYDLIPLLHWSQFSRMFAAHMYFPHFATLFEADRILAISEAAKDQVVSSFSLNPATVVNLRGAAIKRTAAKGIAGVDLQRPYLVMPSADLPHKNNLNAVRAFADFNRELGEVCQLVITSNISEATQRQLSRHTDKLVFTGNITDSELAYLYKHSLGLLFISSIEGLGLPILEAVAYDKPVVCSSIPVFREISTDAFYYCDPTNVASISDALRQLAGKSEWDMRLQRYATIRATYSWPNSAQALRAVISKESVGQAVTQPAGDIWLIMPSPAQWNTTAGVIAQSLAPAFMKVARKVHAYIGRGSGEIADEKPYFLPWILDAHDLPASSINGNDNNVFFIDDSDASVDVLQAAITSPGMCIVTSTKTRSLVEGLQTRGYIPEGMAAAGRSLEEKMNLASLLRKAGNTVYELTIKGKRMTVRGQDGSKTFATMFELAVWIAGEAKGK